MTLGDPTGIGPEVVVCALTGWTGPRPVLHGHAEVIARAAALRGVAVPDAEVRPPAGIDDPFAHPGPTQLAQLRAATAAARAGEVDALVTAPIQKRTIAAAGFAFPGHTEFLGAEAGSARVAMLFAGPRLRVLLATIHLPLREVPAALTVDGLSGLIVLGVRELSRDFGLARPRVAVTGLNPHAGEGGQLGAEEAAIIAPAMQAAREALVREGIPVELRGPLPADVAFRPALHGEVDLVVAMYHDQALIPVKLIDFAQTVNVTLGLPYVRTSPPHGTAHDLAWTGRADATPMRSALELAVALAARRRESSRK